MTYIILTGPSSVGKSTHAKTYGYPIIDSDDIWFQLAQEYKWNKSKVNKNLFERIYKIAMKTKNAVLVHTDPVPLLKYFKKAKIVVVGTNFKKLARNLKIRKDRPTAGVLGDSSTGYLYHFKPSEKGLFLRKKDLEEIPIKTKQDKKTMDKLIETYFPIKKTVRVKPSYKYDTFVIL